MFCRITGTVIITGNYLNSLTTYSRTQYYYCKRPRCGRVSLDPPAHSTVTGTVYGASVSQKGASVYQKAGSTEIMYNIYCTAYIYLYLLLLLFHHYAVQEFSSTAGY